MQSATFESLCLVWGLARETSLGDLRKIHSVREAPLQELSSCTLRESVHPGRLPQNTFHVHLKGANHALLNHTCLIIEIGPVEHGKDVRAQALIPFLSILSGLYPVDHFWIL